MTGGLWYWCIYCLIPARRFVPLRAAILSILAFDPPLGTLGASIIAIALHFPCVTGKAGTLAPSRRVLFVRGTVFDHMALKAIAISDVSILSLGELRAANVQMKRHAEVSDMQGHSSGPEFENIIAEESGTAKFPSDVARSPLPSFNVLPILCS